MASEGMIVSGSDFDCKTHVQFQKPKPNQNGAGKNVGITNAQSKKALVLSTPLLLTWGVNEWRDDATGRVSYDMALQFPSDDYATRATSEFLDALKAHEQYIKDAAVTHSKEWFGKASMSAEVVDALFSPMLRYPKNPETGEADTTRAPTLKIKIPYWQDEFNTEVYDMDMNPLFPNSADPSVTPQTLIQKASNVAVIIQSSGLWFAGGKFGTNWKLVQCVVKPKATLKGKCHITLAPEEKEKLEQQKDASDDEEPESVNVTTEVNDSDDDEDTAQAEPEPEPTPEPKKKRVVKKKKAATDDDE